MRSGASGAGCLDASFAVSAMRAGECRGYSVLSIIAPSVNVLRRTRRKPSTIRGAAPDVVIGQIYGGSRGAHPYRRRRPILNATTSPLYARRYTRASSPRCFLYARRSGSNPRLLSLTNVSFWTAVFGCGSATGLGSLRSSSANLERSNPEKR